VILHWLISAKVTQSPRVMYITSNVASVEKRVKFIYHFISSLLLQKLVAKNAKAATDYSLRVDFQININEMNFVNIVVPYIVTE
jgi:hypothetical protein